MADQVILTSAGAREFTRKAGLLETAQKDISAAPIKICLGDTEDPDGNWIDPDTLDFPTDSSVIVQMLIGGDINPGTVNPSKGAYGLWIKVSDNPEIIPRLIARFVVA